MQIHLGYNLTYSCPRATPMILMLNIRPSCSADIVIPDMVCTQPRCSLSGYRDLFGNWCTRILAPAGVIIFRFPNEGSLRRKLELAMCRLKGNVRPLSYFVDHWNYFNERAARRTFSSAGYEVLRVKKDLSVHGYLARKLFDPLAAHPTAARLVARTIAKVDNNFLSNGLTVVARRRADAQAGEMAA